MFFLDTLSYPPRCQQDLAVELEARIRDAQVALRQATDANRKVARSRLTNALREFTALVFSDPDPVARLDVFRACYDADGYGHLRRSRSIGGDAVRPGGLPVYCGQEPRRDATSERECSYRHDRYAAS